MGKGINSQYEIMKVYININLCLNKVASNY